MARQVLQIGVNENDGTGENLRASMVKVNSNFEELYDYFDNLNASENLLSTNAEDVDLTLSMSGTGRLIVDHGAVINNDEQNLPTAIMNNDSTAQIWSDPVLKRTGINTNSPSTELTVAGDSNITGSLTIDGNLTIGTDATDQITINGELFGDLEPGVAGYNLGTIGVPWDNIYVNNVIATNVSGTFTGNITGDVTGNIIGELTTSTDIRIVDDPFVTLVNTEALTANRSVEFPDASGVLVIKDNNRMRTVYGNAPADAIGTFDDVQGMVAFDNDYMYYCFGIFDGSSAIWKRTPISVW